MRTRFPEGVYRLVIGMNPTVPAILDSSRGRHPGRARVDPATVRNRVHVVRGDPTEWSTISAARPEGAQQALITGASDGDVLVSAVLVRKQAADLPIVALVTSPSVREALRDLGIRQTVSAHELVAGTLATSLETPHADEMVRQLVESDRHVLAEVEVAPEMAGKPLSTVREERAELVLGLVHDGEFTLGIAGDSPVAAGDRLLIAETARNEQSRG